MHRFIFVLACLVQIGHGRPLQPSKQAFVPDTAKPLTAFARFLLAHKPAAAYHPAGAGVHFPSSKPALTHSHPVSRSSSPGMQFDDAEPSTSDKATSAAVYLLPCTDAFNYGSYIYKAIPPVGLLASGFAPLYDLVRAIPFGSLILFFALSSQSRNPNLSRYLRFNLQQALLLDIFITIPMFFQRAANQFVPYEVTVFANNFLFYGFVITIFYIWKSCAKGKVADKVPLISNAAVSQMGPF
mmetsp:Transcript_55194/g.96600  ORF Transcript_55194/g.96600 Transcript_55194/m.96600 type:complete len:241 (+) Transcript_55194:84-806(+)